MRFLSKLRPTTLLAAAALGALAGCGDLADQLQAEDIAIGALVNIPDQEDPATHENIPGLTTMTVFFGHIDKSKITVGSDGKQSAAAGAFTPNTGATVTLDFKDPTTGDKTVGVAPKAGADGTYFIDSSQAANLKFYSTPYTLKIAYSGKTYVMKVTPAAITKVKEFQTEKIISNHAAGTPFDLTRVNGLGPTKNPIAFVALKEVASGNASDAYTNAPQDALGMLQLVLDDSPWRADKFTIPGNEFVAGKNYVAALTALERGTPAAGTGDALFVGSSFLAGATDGGGILVP